MDRAISVTGPVTVAELGVTLPHEQLGQPTPRRRGDRRRGGAAVRGRGWIDRRRRDADVAGPWPRPEGAPPHREHDWSHHNRGNGTLCQGRTPPEIDNQSAEEIAAEIVSEVSDGIGETGVRAGIIGEVGASHPFAEHPNEQKNLRAAAIAQAETGAPITLHPPVMHQEANEMLDVLEDAGTDLENVVVGHLDGALRTEDASTYYDSLANRGVYLEFDTFGRIGYNATADRCFPLDETRILELRRLVEAGYGEQLLVSHDICKKNQLTRYAGFGYDYILRDIVPRMRRHGFDEETLELLLERNPARMLAVQ